MSDVRHAKPRAKRTSTVLQQTVHSAKILSIEHCSGEFIDVVPINLATLPMLCIEIPIQHVQGDEVNSHPVWAAFQHVDNGLIWNVICDSISIIIIVFKHRHVL